MLEALLDLSPTQEQCHHVLVLALSGKVQFLRALEGRLEEVLPEAQGKVAVEKGEAEKSQLGVS